MIAMFDSGLGGLSVWQAVTRALPNWSISYLADQAYWPYGPRSQAEITERSLQIGGWFCQQGAQLLVVACNTATSAAVDHMRQALPIPVVAIEPAVKPAAANSKTGRIAVLATEFMLNSHRFQSLLKRHAGSVQVLSRPGQGWVERVEAGDLDSPLARQLVDQVIRPLLHENIDHLVLGCTHYPFLAPLIREITGDQIILDDPANAIASRVSRLITQNELKPLRPAGHYHFHTTARDPSSMAERLPTLIGQQHAVLHADV